MNDVRSIVQAWHEKHLEMTSQNDSPLRARPSKYASRAAAPRSTKRRLALRLLALPILGVMAVMLYSGLKDYVVLPTCDSDRAKKSLSDVLKELNFEPAHYEPIKTVSSSKEEVVCNAVLPLPGGGNVIADFTFYWQGSKANMRYSISRKSS
jgi:hypothetical protein